MSSCMTIPKSKILSSEINSNKCNFSGLYLACFSAILNAQENIKTDGQLLNPMCYGLFFNI